MQIVRDLAGYTLGADADLVRRAMSKKKGTVMEQERKNFVYGNEEEECSRLYCEMESMRKWQIKSMMT